MPGAPQPYTSFWGGANPFVNPSDVSPVTLGHVMLFTNNTWLYGVKFFRDLADGGDHIGYIREVSTRRLLRIALFHYKPASGSGADSWQSAYFQKRFFVPHGHVVEVGVWFQAGNYWRALNYCTAGDVTHGNITLPQDSSSQYNGTYTYQTNLLTNLHYMGSGYGVDCISLQV